MLLRFHDRLLDRLDEFADLVQYDAGKARLSAIEEVLHAALECAVLRAAQPSATSGVGAASACCPV